LQDDFNSNDLTGLIDVFPLLNALQFDQLTCESTENVTCFSQGKTLYGDNAFNVTSFMFDKVEAWQNITDDNDRFRNSSNLLALVDEIGDVTLKELKLRRWNYTHCPFIYKSYNFVLPNVTLVAKLGQHQRPAKDIFVLEDFSGMWKISVPYKYLSSCILTVGASIANLPLKENKVFPRYPTKMETENANKRGQNFPNGLYPFVVGLTTSILPNTLLVTDVKEKVVIEFFHEEKVKTCSISWYKNKHTFKEKPGSKLCLLEL